ncbi:MAG: tRNA threonylcarbamoyladenosine biosynthesis protein [Microgenomates group bacterium Gr01-1014_7]|nr:MAG: tRNA threonylcarbamoyladenosine biosynthesis protein [Microgenomates group bacterium Gr01-1014_7]
MKLQEITKSLKAGKIGVIPTDTIYGIVGSALNPQTIEKIYRLKKRSKSKPFIILISALSDLKQFNVKLSKQQKKFLEKIWPNPVSVVLSGLAFRMPKDKWLISLLKRVGPLVGPSANFAGEKPAENIEQAKRYFKDNVDFYCEAARSSYIDGGKIKSKSSTIIELNRSGKFKVLRQGTYRV